jgi:hypothetical protein
MIRTQVSLEQELYEEARREAQRRGVSFAELCRLALAHEIRHGGAEEPTWMRFAGSVEVDDPAASSTVDEVVYGQERP